MLPLIALGITAAGATAGAIGSSVNTRRARKEESRFYKDASARLDALRYEDITKTPSGAAILKLRNEQRLDDLDAMDNRAAAGGATVENRLAAMKAENRSDSRLMAELLQSDEARRRSAEAQRLSLDQQHSGNVQNSYLQNAQDWQAWGSVMGDAAMSFGNTAILGKQAGMTNREILGLPKK